MELPTKDNYFSVSISDVTRLKQDADALLTARKMLEEFHRAIQAAHGGTSLEGIAKSSIAEFLLVAARNNIQVTATYLPPQKN